MSRTLQRIPAHLRGFVVQQDYERYTEVDQAVWRFALLQMFARLKETAHPAYGHGLVETGMSVERIPRIAEMDACLGRFGWGAVCVDGFIPPRAFQEFQAIGVLPIAADIRSVEHLPYTPAPDIIHEAAGHAPVLVDSDYAAYVRHFGMIGARAFSSAEDRQVYQAIFDLSEVKEIPNATPEQVAASERRLQRALSQVTYVTEAARLARLYWWTAEYGLVGTPTEYRLYGAGLLSSLGESHFCHRDSVKKIPLSVDCMDVDYDITQPQPQLFVVPSFERLGSVLDEAATTLAYRRGGHAALAEARRSGELCTVETDASLDITGRLAEFLDDGDRTRLLVFEASSALSVDGRLLPNWGPKALSDGQCFVAFGPLEDGRSVTELSLGEISRRLAASGIALSGGLSVAGAAERIVSLREARGVVLCFASARVLSGERHAVVSEGRCTVVLLDGDVRTAHAGAADPAFYPETEYSSVRVPKAQVLSHRSRELLHLYERAIEIWRGQHGSSVVSGFAEIERLLRTDYPDEWLLRWNLLESLIKIGQKDVGSDLYGELERLEVRYRHEQPIHTGLQYLMRRAGGASSTEEH